MLHRSSLVTAALACLSSLAWAEEAPETLLLQDPTVSREHVAFVYAQDLWIVGRTGGVAHRLTSHVGREFSPRFSPDGKWIAFSGEYEGNIDVYAVPVDGGTPTRLTWHPEADVVQGWHPDGERILFVSPRLGGAPVHRPYLVRRGGGTPVLLDLPKVHRAAWNEDGTRIAYTPIPDAFRSWKRYRGGRTTPIWICDPATLEVEQVPHVNASDTFPCWLGGAVYFASDRDGHMNLHRYAPGSGKVEPLTRYTDFDVRNLTAGGGVAAFEQAGAIHLFDPATNAVTRLRIAVLSDGLMAVPRWQEVKGFVRNASVAPNGKRAAFEARGEIVTVPREHGDPRNLSDSPGAHDRDPAWSPDGKRIAWFSDAGGEYRLVVRNALGREPGEAYGLGGGGFFFQPTWSPDGKRVLFSDKTSRLAFLTLATRAVVEVSRSQGTLGVYRPDFAWSPDSKWIAFTQRDSATAYDRLSLYDMEGMRTLPLTDGFASVGNPAFSGDGKFLFFTGTVDSGPLRFGLDLSASAARGSNASVYACVLQRAGKSPLAPRSDEGVDDDKEKKAKKEKEKDQEKEDEGKKSEEEKDGNGEERDKKEEEKKKKEPIPPLEPEGIDQRIVALPLPAGEYAALGWGKGKLLFQAGSELKSYDFDTRKTESVAKDASWFQVAANGKSVLTKSKSKEKWAVQGVDGKERKELAIDPVKVRVEPEHEWPQILHEVWRIQRDFFYDRNMHGVDWPAMWRRWSAFLPHVRHRADLNLLIAEMIGELCCGHEYVDGGETPRVPAGAATGLLGADFAAAEGRFRIARIYRGQNWSPGMRAPLTEPGVDARVGDWLVAVNGAPLKAGDNLHAAFADTADRQVELTLAAKPDGTEPRKVTVVPVADDSGLRRQAWVEANRKRVDELSSGRLAYVYMPDTGGGGLAAFTRDYFSQLDKEGLILDERYNRGGKVADYVVEVLSRKVYCYWMNREEWLGRTPFGTMPGPKVMMINERAGSGGDAMPWLFRKLGLGPLVGTRTWGGLVGISGYPALMDGGSVTAASFGIMDTDGEWAVENVGVAPDVEVVEWPKDLVAGRDPQLEKAVELALAALAREPQPKKPAYKPPTPR